MTTMHDWFKFLLDEAITVIMGSLVLASVYIFFYILLSGLLRLIEYFNV